MAAPANLTHVVPDHLHHPRVLGRGSSKMVWFSDPGDRWLFMNAHPSQVYRQGDPPHVRQRKRLEAMYKQKTEFLFTHAIRAYFPLFIPEVHEIQPYATFQDNDRRFRYLKERCEPFPLDDEAFPRMIGLLRDLYAHDVVYLDIKPVNLGIVRGNVCILDTDPDSFYRVPPEFKDYFIYSGFITAVLYSFQHVPQINKATIRDFVIAILTPAICDAVFAADINQYRAAIAAANVDFMTPLINRVREQHPVAMPIAEEIARNIQLPMEFITHYGTQGGIAPRARLELIRQWVA